MTDPRKAWDQAIDDASSKISNLEQSIAPEIEALRQSIEAQVQVAKDDRGAALGRALSGCINEAIYGTEDDGLGLHKVGTNTSIEVSDVRHVIEDDLSRCYASVSIRLPAAAINEHGWAYAITAEAVEDAFANIVSFDHTEIYMGRESITLNSSSARVNLYWF